MFEERIGGPGLHQPAGAVGRRRASLVRVLSAAVSPTDSGRVCLSSGDRAEDPAVDSRQQLLWSRLPARWHRQGILPAAVAGGGPSSTVIPRTGAAPVLVYSPPALRVRSGVTPAAGGILVVTSVDLSGLRWQQICGGRASGDVSF